MMRKPSVCTYIRNSDLSALMTSAFCYIVIALLNYTHCCTYGLFQSGYAIIAEMMRTPPIKIVYSAGGAVYNLTLNGRR